MGTINTLKLLYQVRKNQWLKPAELKKLQEKKLGVMIRYAYENTKFYHDKFKSVHIRPEDIKTVDELGKIPFTTKEELRKFGLDHILANNINLNMCRLIPTSGSTGTPLKVVYDRRADEYSKVINLRSMMENGLKIRDKWVNIGDTRTIRKQTMVQKLGFFNIITLNIFDSIEDQINTLIKIRPDVIVGYPSQLNLIVKYIEKYSINEIIPKVVFTTSELLDQKTRKLIDSVFDIKLIDLFGCIEVNRTAWECSEHCGYHLDIDSVTTEFVDDYGDCVSCGERGNIAYTSLYNFAMPLIRYKVGDIGVPSDEYCTCGRSLPMMKSVEGRSDDFILLPSGRTISPIALALVMKHSDGIIEYQFVQETLHKMSLYLVPSGEIKDIEKLEMSINNILGNDITIDIKIIDKLERNKSGKIRSVISKVNI